MAPSSFFRSQLPVWPPTRFQWPAPRSLCSGRGSGSQGFWVAGASQLRVRRHAFAEKQEPESHSTFAFKTWTWLVRALSTIAVWRSWPTACLFHGAQLAVDTTLFFVLSRDGTPHPRCVTTVQLLKLLGDGKRRLIPS